MANPKQIGMLLVGALLWVGLCQVGLQVPWVGQRAAAADDSGIPRAEVLPYREAVEICSHVEPPTSILYVVPSGKTVQKGDLLVELDASALTDKRIQQVVQVRKAEGEMILARESQARDEQAAQGRIPLAEKALRLAQNQLKAYTEGEFPRQLALAEGTAQLAKERRSMTEDRAAHLRASFETQKDQAVLAALQEAQLAFQEASLQATAAEGALAFLKSFAHDNKVAELELAVAQREFELARAKDDLSRAITTGGVARSWTAMSFEWESDRLAKLDDQIVKAKIYAPRDGIVAYPNDANEPPIKAGTVVRDRQVLIRLLPVTPAKP